jgi:hypothetical protein
MSLGALPGEPRFQHLGGLGDALLALRRIGQASQDVQPVDHRMGGPLVGRNGEAAQHAGAGLAVARQGFNGRELAHVEVFAGCPELALDAAFHKRRQPPLQRRTGLIGQAKGRVQTRCLVGRRQQVGAEHIAAAVAFAVARREVAGQAVAVQVGGQLRHHGLPEPGVAQANGLAGLLLQARKRVG